MIEDRVKRYLVEQVRQAVEKLTKPLIEVGMLPEGVMVHVDLVMPAKLEKVEATIALGGGVSMTLGDGAMLPDARYVPSAEEVQALRDVIEPRAVGQSRRSASLDAVARLEGQIESRVYYQGARVIPTHDPKHDSSYQAGAVESRRANNGKIGTVLRSHDSHGLCYLVDHDQGGQAFWEPDELREESDPTKPIPWPSEPAARLKMLESAERAYLLLAGWKPASEMCLMWTREGRKAPCLRWEAVEIQRAEDSEP